MPSYTSSFQTPYMCIPVPNLKHSHVSDHFRYSFISQRLINQEKSIIIINHSWVTWSLICTAFVYVSPSVCALFVLYFTQASLNLKRKTTNKRSQWVCNKPQCTRVLFLVSASTCRLTIALLLIKDLIRKRQTDRSMGLVNCQGQ